MYSYQKIILVLLASIITQSCAGFKEAFRDRVPGGKPAIQIGCTQKTYLSTRKLVSNSDIRLIVRSTPGPSEPVIGYLWAFGPAHLIPVSVAGPPPNSVLAADIREILVHNGYQVIEDSQLAQVFIEAGFTVIHSEQDFGSWTGTTSSQVDITIQVIYDGEILWRREFSETKDDKSYYALTSDIEKTINRAYCNILDSVDKEIMDKDFQSAINREVD